MKAKTTKPLRIPTMKQRHKKWNEGKGTRHQGREKRSGKDFCKKRAKDQLQELKPGTGVRGKRPEDGWCLQRLNLPSRGRSRALHTSGRARRLAQYFASGSTMRARAQGGESTSQEVHVAWCHWGPLLLHYLGNPKPLDNLQSPAIQPNQKEHKAEAKTISIW